MSNTTWNANPPCWTHPHLGKKIWICNEGIRSSLRNSEPGGRYHFVGCAAVANQLAAAWMWLAGAIPFNTVHSNWLLCFVILRNPWFSLGNNKCFWKENEKLHCEIIDNVFEKWRRWVVSFNPRLHLLFQQTGTHLGGVNTPPPPAPSCSWVWWSFATKTSA